MQTIVYWKTIKEAQNGEHHQKGVSSFCAFCFVVTVKSEHKLLAKKADGNIVFETRFALASKKSAQSAVS